MRNTEEIWTHVERKSPDYIALSDRVWATPELAYGEHRSAAAHLEQLQREGFRITQNLAGIPTALMAEAGEGGPVIAILGEYDALPGLSQEAGIAEPKPVEGVETSKGVALRKVPVRPSTTVTTIGSSMKADVTTAARPSVAIGLRRIVSTAPPNTSPSVRGRSGTAPGWWTGWWTGGHPGAPAEGPR